MIPKEQGALNSFINVWGNMWVEVLTFSSNVIYSSI